MPTPASFLQLPVSPSPCLADVLAELAESAESTSPPPLDSPPLSLSQIEARFQGRIWRGNALGTSPDPVIFSGFHQLDEVLPGGGWPTRNLTELLLPAEGLGEISLLGPSLEQMARKDRNILLVGPPYIPCLNAWENLGIDSRRIVMIRISKPAERLWALEQGIRSGAFGAIIGWLSQASHQVTRRLQVLARAAVSLVFLFRPESAQFEPSAAPLRVVLAPARLHALSVHVFKRRGAPAASPLRIALPQTRPFSSSTGVFSPEAFSSGVSSLYQPNAVDRSALPGAVA